MKRAFIILLITISMSLSAANAAAGTYFLGTKGWVAVWDSGILDWLEKDLAESFSTIGTFSADRDPGDGYLAGPLLGYQTDDRKWSFSFAPMIFSSFSQDWDGMAGTMDLDGSIALDRKDYDFAANYALSDKYKLFAGLKYQDMDMDFTITYDTVSSGTVTNTYKVDADAIIPTIGAGIVHPLSTKVVASGQLGLLYSFTELKVSNQMGLTEDIWPRPGLGFNAEGNLTWQAANSLLLQLGYRYQVFTIEARGPGRTDITKSYDITYGGTLSAVFTF